MGIASPETEADRHDKYIFDQAYYGGFCDAIDAVEAILERTKDEDIRTTIIKALREAADEIKGA